MPKIITENLNTRCAYKVRMVQITLNWKKVNSASCANFIEKKGGDDQKYVLTKLSSKSDAAASPAELAWYRSVIWERRTSWEKDGGRDADMIVNHIPVCVAPPKAWNMDVSGQTKFEGARVEDFVEGTMLTVS